MKTTQDLPTHFMDTADKQSPHWLDDLVERILAWQQEHSIKQLHVDDMKTPSGRVHVGALRGVILHDLVAKALRVKLTQKVKFTYVFNNMDNMDSLPGYLPSNYEQHMGRPLFKIPAPKLESSGIDFSLADITQQHQYATATDMGQFYAFDFIEAFQVLGAEPELVWSNQLYQSGEMDAVIRTSLDAVDQMRQIYQEVADYKLPELWYPFQVFCEQCGLGGSTLVTAWDGEKVTYECQPAKTAWAKGCGYHGRISPFGGTGKLLWKVDWPAHWTHMGVTIEGAGKDHTSAGGSRDMANAMCTRVFHRQPPFDIPYEWILIRGAKMSSSKGVGMSARDFVQILPPPVGRFLFTSRHYNQVIDFDPSTVAIPDLFDEYDEGARIFWSEIEGDQRLGRSFDLAQIGTPLPPQFLPRFRDVVQWLQFPNVDLVVQFGRVKGSSLTPVERATLHERVQYAKRWLESSAPDSVRFLPSKVLPASVASFTPAERQFLSSLLELTQSKAEWEPEHLHNALFSLAKSSIGTSDGFRVVYQTIIGKPSGPKAGWLLASLDRSFLINRLKEASGGKEIVQNTQSEQIIPNLNQPDLFSMTPAFAQLYPTAHVGIAIIRGVSIQEKNDELNELIEQTLPSLTLSDPAKLNDFPEIQSYRTMYKQMGVDWHSRRPSPEALLRRLAQGKGFPRINTCVDAYNLVVMKHRVSLGAFDLAGMQLPTWIDMAKGGETIDLIGKDEPVQIEAGEVCYFDQLGAYNLDFNYRDARRCGATLESHDLMINVDGIGQITRGMVEQSLSEAVELITRFCGGTVEVMGIVAATES